MNNFELDSFQVIADPSRREILMMLSKKKLSINEIAKNFNISRPAISKHIKVLEVAGFIFVEEKGRERCCMLNPEGLQRIQEWINFLKVKKKTTEKSFC
ncbi:ArsR/SmtB family transcription factor [Pedobacter cryoconitis]|uniref:DNA-binding transcriptional ArsR family regulator n=1 Tax=Pedobacter cryoconitis TaxID=188932 RepID=A0A7X0MK82_9SPHI|nr:metalloregulator ArsR/SmtB family transcription factor [Pedobacter cryoconitis]MBB6501781.1 DNA-binding transcriptional ArsR family regulator [Pedobacter cryoconitis]